MSAIDDCIVAHQRLKIGLIPYGCTNVRITEFPKVAEA